MDWIWCVRLMEWSLPSFWGWWKVHQTVFGPQWPHLSCTIYQWNSVFPLHESWINMQPNVSGVTSEMILGRGNNHNPSNGSGRYNPHVVRVELGLLNPYTAAWQTITEMEVVVVVSYLCFVIPVMSSSVRERAFCCRTKRNLQWESLCHPWGNL